MRAPVGYGQLIRGNFNFRYLWLGQVVSLLGDWFNLIASAALIANLSQSGFAVSSLFLVRMLSPFLVTPLGGVLADRYNRRHILIGTDLLRALAVLGMLLVRSPQDLWLLYTLTAVQLALSGIFYPARTAILPEVVSTHELGTANALSSTTWSVMLAFGAALGGLVSGIWGIYPAFVIDALTFLLSGYFIWRVGYRPDQSAQSGDHTTRAAVGEYLESLRYLRANPDTLMVTLQKACCAVFVGGFQVLQVAIARDVFTIGEAGGTSLGLLFACSGVGTGIGPILARRLTGDRDGPMRTAILYAYLVIAIGLVVTAPLSSFLVVLLGTFLRGLGGGMVWVFSTQILFQVVPKEIQGRVFATEFAAFTLTSAVGVSVVGMLLDWMGLMPSIWWMAGLILLPGLLWWLWLRRVKAGH